MTSTYPSVPSSMPENNSGQVRRQNSTYRDHLRGITHGTLKSRDNQKNDQDRGEQDLLLPFALLLASDLFAVGFRYALQSIGVGVANRLRHESFHTLRLKGLSSDFTGDTTEALRDKNTVSSFMCRPIFDTSLEQTQCVGMQSRKRSFNPSEYRGLPNRGQTCYANSVFQALASLSPLYTYLETLHHQHKERQHRGRMYDKKCDVSVSVSLFETLQYVNGINPTEDYSSRSRRRKRRVANSCLQFPLFASNFSSNRGDPQTVMNVVAQRHSQFRSRGYGSRIAAGMTEQQDAHEFFSALVEDLSLDDNCCGPIGMNVEMASPLEGLASLENFGSNNVEVDRGWECSCLRCQRNLPESESHHLAPDFHEINGVGEYPFASSSHNKVTSANDDEQAESEGKDFDQNSSHSSSSPTSDLQEEKKYEGNSDESFEKNGECKYQHKDMQIKKSTGDPLPNHHHLKSVANQHTSTANDIQALAMPFDGWIGSTIKCSSCLHIRPIRSTPFLELSLPIAANSASSLECILKTEYGGFDYPERVSDVLCNSCAIQKKKEELEEELELVSGAIASVQRRCRGKMGQSLQQTDDGEIIGLTNESQLISAKISVLESVDPDADEEEDSTSTDKDPDFLDEATIEQYGTGEKRSQLPFGLSPVRRNAKKATLLMRPPQILCIHVQRRHYDMNSQRMSKSMRHIAYPETLDISELCAYSKNGFESPLTSGTECNTDNGKTVRGEQSTKIRYKLMSVIEHKGNAFGGHYQTYRRSEWDICGSKGAVGGEVMPNQKPEREWVLISDECVSFRSWGDVKRCQAYMLFYVAIP